VLALNNLTRSPLRTGLTIIGVAMGIAMLVSISGYGNSIGSQLQNAVTNRYQLIVQSAKVASPLSSSISLADLQQIRRIQGIEEIQPIVIGSTRTERIPYFLLIGVASSAALAGNVSLVDGAWNDSQKAEIMLGHSAATSLRVDVDGDLQLQQDRYRVSGVFSSESNILNHAGITRLGAAQKLLNRGTRVNLLLPRTTPGQASKPIARQFVQQYPHLQLTRSADLLGRLELFIVIEKVTTSLSLIALLFCILIVMNTLLMSLSERRREIGILMAIGWSRWMIARSLLAESLLISILGSLLGMGAGAYLLHYFSQSNIAGVNWGTAGLSVRMAAIALLLSLLIALLSAIYPLYISSRWLPAQILQRE